ncbi:MAG TPA: hypothetical protein VJJ52_04485 [Candidatus Nanoarchaeia archaeon]|nr:hypothetical protein [Candidatus Nanoarchaeia archaeon]
MDYQQIIDGLKWTRCSKEIELGNALKSAATKREEGRLLVELSGLRTEPPLRQAGLEKPVFYAFQARAEWEILGLADKLQPRLQEEYDLHPAGQSGVGLDWVKLNRIIWVPADYLEARTIKPNTRAIFSQDEVNCFGFSVSDDITAEDLELKRKILYGSNHDTNYKYDGSSTSKIKALLTDADWRKDARTYSRRLLFAAGSGYKKYVKEEFLSVLEALVSDFQLQMQ